MNSGRKKAARSLGRKTLQFVGICVGIGLVVPLLQWSFGSQTVANFRWQWFLSSIYSASISGSLWMVMPMTWMKTLAWPAVPRWFLRGFVIIACAFLGCLVGGLADAAFRPEVRPLFWADFWGSFRLALIITGVATIFTGTYETLHHQLRTREVQLKAKELERERALKLATEARLASLESRIHPHFLFNTINSVSSLIYEDPERAERLLTRMASLLRFSLDSGQTGLVPLERELKIVRDYLEIESARFDLRLRHQIEVPADLLSLPVPPLAIQTLVENSVKYAVSSRRQGATIWVSATREGQFALLQVSDDGPGFTDFGLPAGHGLSNLQERLDALFGDRARLDISSSGEKTSVRVLIPIASAKLEVAV